MTTASRAIDWAIQQNGKFLDFDGKYGGQCVDLYQFFARFLGWPTVWLPYAYQYWDHNFDGLATKGDKPLPGAVCVWTNANGIGGHIAIVIEVANDTKFRVAAENDVNSSANGSPVALVWKNMSNVAGFIYPNYDPEPEQSAPTPQVSDDELTNGQYTVKPNDTYWALESKWGINHGVLQDMNPNAPAHNLQIGQTIAIPVKAQAQVAAETPAPKKYTMVKNDNYWNLENEFGWRHGILTEMNPGMDPRAVPIGYEINIPG